MFNTASSESRVIMVMSYETWLFDASSVIPPCISNEDINTLTPTVIIGSLTVHITAAPC
jgi:hypothetical protein